MMHAAVPRPRQESPGGAPPAGLCCEDHSRIEKPTMTSMIRLARNRDIVGREVTQPKQLKLMSVEDVADYAKVSTQTVRRWIKAGYLKIYRAGRQIRIDEADLLAYLSGQAGRDPDRHVLSISA